jgi:hypothetical protein
MLEEGGGRDSCGGQVDAAECGDLERPVDTEWYKVISVSRRVGQGPHLVCAHPPIMMKTRAHIDADEGEIDLPPLVALHILGIICFPRIPPSPTGNGGLRLLPPHSSTHQLDDSPWKISPGDPLSLPKMYARL